MEYAHFLRSLLETGTVQAGDAGPSFSPQQVEQGRRYLSSFEKHYRLELPGTPPEFDVAVADWAAQWFYQSCRFALFRQHSAAAMREILQDGPWNNKSPEVCYSVDLTFRFLPDLLQIVQAAADPLADTIRWGCRRWGLSSVGVPNLDDVEISGVLQNRSLLTLYVDRVIEKQDVSRLTVPQVREAVRAAFGESGIPMNSFGRRLTERPSKENVL